MPTMVKPYRPGASTRRAILLELRRRELAGERAPTLAELATVAGVTTSTARRQTVTMASAGLIHSRFYGYRATRLTEAGRLAADAAAIQD